MAFPFKSAKKDGDDKKAGKSGMVGRLAEMKTAGKFKKKRK